MPLLLFPREMGKSVRVDDLFNRSQRTDFYTMKLEALHPPTLVVRPRAE